MQEFKIIELSIEELQQIISDTFRTEINNVLLTLKDIKSEVEYLTREETSELLRISLPTLQAYTERGLLKGYRIGTRILYKLSEVKTALIPIKTLKYKRR